MGKLYSEEKGEASGVPRLEAASMGGWREANHKHSILVIDWAVYLAFSGWSSIGIGGNN